MQSLAPLTLSDFLAEVNEPLIKLELDYGGSWQTPDDIISDTAGSLLKSASTSLSGANPTISVVAGSWSAEAYNPNAIFHPLNPDTTYIDIFQVGRKVKIWNGIKVGGTEYFREVMRGIISDVDFNTPDQTVRISGMDYCQALADYKINTLSTRFFGEEWMFIVAEIEFLGDYGKFEAAGFLWAPLYCTVASIGGGQTGNCMEITRVSGDYQLAYWVVSGVEKDSTYKFEGYVKSGTSGNEEYRILVSRNDIGQDDIASFRGISSGGWVKFDFDFVSPISGDLQIGFEKSTATAGTMLIDTFTVTEIKQRRYPMDTVAYPSPPYGVPKGAIAVRYLVPSPTVEYFEKEDWTWEETNPDLLFSIGAALPAIGEQLYVCVFTATSPEDVVFYYLYLSGLYASAADAQSDSIYTATGITIDRVSFEAGTTALEAITKMAERVNYKFFFRYDGKPCFIPKPAIEAVGNEDLSLLQNQVTDVQYFRNDAEVYNRITLTGEEQSYPTQSNTANKNNLSTSVNDNVSIALYGEKNLQITNYFWQTQAVIDAFAAVLLADLKDAKNYITFAMSSCPLPVEWGDTLKVQWRLTPSSGGDYFGIGEFGIAEFGAEGLIVIKRGLVRDIKVVNFIQQITLELEA